MDSLYELDYIPLTLENFDIAYNIQKNNGQMIPIIMIYMKKQLKQKMIILFF